MFYRFFMQKQKVEINIPSNPFGFSAYPSTSADGLTFYYSKLWAYWPHIWICSMDSIDSEWGSGKDITPQLVPCCNWPGPLVGNPSISSDGLTLYYNFMPGPDYQTYMVEAIRLTLDSPWVATFIDSGHNPSSPIQPCDWAPFISYDGLTLYFVSSRPGGYGGYDIWKTTRAFVGYPWGPAENLVHIFINIMA
jgi:Tol biopolymer transport system component